MRIVCISDTHNFTDEITIPDGDVLVHAGDSTKWGNLKELDIVADWFHSLPHKHKVLISGNHDNAFQEKRDLAEEKFKDFHYLRDSSVSIEGKLFYGSPWQPIFGRMAFNLKRGAALKKKWDLIPANTDVLVTHGPPAYRLDKIVNGEGVGSLELYKAVDRIKPKIHIFGHIHESYGQADIAGTKFINASICTLAYQPTNKPIVVDID